MTDFSIRRRNTSIPSSPSFSPNQGPPTAVRRTQAEGFASLERFIADQPNQPKPHIDIAKKTEASGLSPTQIQKNIDAFFDKASASYDVTTTDGRTISVRVPPQFRMTSGYNGPVWKNRQNIEKALGPTAYARVRPFAELVVQGRASPEQIALVTRELIGAGHLPPIPADYAHELIQNLQWVYGIGIDCAGYVQQAFVAARGGKEYGFRDPLNENLGGLESNTKFRRVDPREAQPGDIITLSSDAPGSVGHTVLLRSRTLLDDATKQKLTPSGQFAAGNVHVFEVDSSWGAGERGEHGGVKRKTWLYSETTRGWATYDPHMLTLRLSTQSGPYDHPMGGMFRPKGQP